MPNVAFVHPSLKPLLDVYEKTEDCILGDFQVKFRKTKYLPMPNADDISPANLARYKAYLERAIFYNVTKATYSGLIGQVFVKDTQIEIPNSVDFLEKNADGSGKGLNQLAKEGLGYLLSGARFGLLADYPQLEEPVSKTQKTDLNIRASIKMYPSKKIINWRTKNLGAEIVYSLIVLEENEVYYDDGFEFKTRKMYRVLRLNNEGNYQVEIYKTDKLFNVPDSTTIPTDFNGNPLKRIPFEFCGCDNNDAEPDIPVLYDIAVLNIGHYRNSADYEESCYIVGQPTPWFSGLTEDWVKSNGVIQLGSRGAVPLPENGTAGLLQAQPNIMPYEAMQHKEQQFLALGAKLVTPSQGSKTATEAGIDNVTETSILGNITVNTSMAFENTIKNCLKFEEAGESKVTFKLNTDFEISKMSIAERNQVLNEWLKGEISLTEARELLRKGKVAIGDDEKAITDIEQETLDSFKIEMQNPANKQIAPIVGK